MVMETLETESVRANLREDNAPGEGKAAKTVVHGTNPNAGNASRSKLRLRQVRIVVHFIRVQARIAENQVQEFIPDVEPAEKESAGQNRHQEGGTHLVIVEDQSARRGNIVHERNGSASLDCGVVDQTATHGTISADNSDESTHRRTESIRRRLDIHAEVFETKVAVRFVFSDFIRDAGINVRAEVKLTGPVRDCLGFIVNDGKNGIGQAAED